MGIRVEHQPSPYAVGLAAYATGYGGAKLRQQKYALDLVAQDRMMQQRNIEQQNRLKYADALDMRNRQWAVDDMAAQNTARQAEMDQKHEWDVAETTRRENNAYFAAQGASIPKIPDYATPEQRMALSKKAQAIKDLYSGQYDMGDGSDIEEADRLRQEYEAEVMSIPKPDAAAELNKKITHYNPKTGTFQPNAEPGVTRPWIDGKPADDGQAKQEAAGQAAQQKAQQKFESDNAAWETKRDKITQEYIDVWKLNNPGKELPGEEHVRFQQAADMRMEALGKPKPQMPTAPAGAPAAPGAAPAAPAAPEIGVGDDGTAVMPQSAPQAPATQPATQPTAPTATSVPVPTVGQLLDAFGSTGVPQPATTPISVTSPAQPVIEPPSAPVQSTSPEDANFEAIADRISAQNAVQPHKDRRAAEVQARKARVSMKKAGFGGAAVNGVPVVRSKTEYEALKAAGLLPSGTVYIGSDGQQRRVS